MAVFKKQRPAELGGVSPTITRDGHVEIRGKFSASMGEEFKVEIPIVAMMRYLLSWMQFIVIVAHRLTLATSLAEGGGVWASCLMVQNSAGLPN